eukprot:GHVU01110867.1.p1 GENE.GHVU01110867.1~~GHVU01110867.1.p1  ORF type:complete len:111 (+),score=11.54 GHVU01110867.1:2166-2498(+)
MHACPHAQRVMSRQTPMMMRVSDLITPSDFRLPIRVHPGHVGMGSRQSQINQLLQHQHQHQHQHRQLQTDAQRSAVTDSAAAAAAGYESVGDRGTGRAPVSSSAIRRPTR